MDSRTPLPEPRPSMDRAPGSLSPRPGFCPPWCTLDHLDPSNDDDFHYGPTTPHPGPIELCYAVNRDEQCAARDAVSLSGLLDDQRWTPAGLAALGRALVEIGEDAGRLLAE